MANAANMVRAPYEPFLTEPQREALDAALAAKQKAASGALYGALAIHLTLSQPTHAGDFSCPSVRKWNSCIDGGNCQDIVHLFFQVSGLLVGTQDIVL
jgi:hypothetical protein